MRRRALHAVVALAGLVLASSVTAGLMGSLGPSPEGPPETVAAAEPAPAEPGHDHHNTSEPRQARPTGPPVAPATPRHDHLRQGEPGRVPTRAEATELPHQFESFTVRGDQGLAEMADRGYLTGQGTQEAPYVLEGFRVRDDLTIEDTSRPLIVRGSYIQGQLTLNYVGESLYVHHNHVGDLRVNENVQRMGEATAGLFEHNEIAFVGQLRHFAGELRHNTIGPRPDDVVTEFLSDTGVQTLDDGVVWNLDGYHGALVHNNTVVGRVDVKLHGHFHGSCNACLPHDHGEPAGFPNDRNQREEGLPPGSPHSLRHHTLVFRDNQVRVDGQDTALRFYDEAHAGDDQRANSEPNAYLEDLHEHHTFLAIVGNHVRGGALALDIVNARDDRHEGQVQEALVHLRSNAVEMEQRRTGLQPAYVVHGAQGLTLEAIDNGYTFTPRDSALPAGYRWVTRGPGADPAGFLLDTVETSNVTIAGTTGEQARYGVVLEETAESLHLAMRGNAFGAETEVHHA